MPSRPYPYGLHWEQLTPEPLSRDMRDDPQSLVEELAGARATEPQYQLNNDELHRMFDAALGLAMKMVLDPEYAGWSRGQILTVAIDTALIWERG